jgi:glycine oxidase
MTDVVIIGGGVVGLTTACELSGRGCTVTVLDRSQPGREASWAGAGILPPGRPGDPAHPLAPLFAESRRLWPGLSWALKEQTGLENGFRRCGGIELSADASVDELTRAAHEWRRAGVVAELLSPGDLRHMEPGLEPAPAFHLPELCQIRNPWHLRTLLEACRRQGVQVLPDEPVVDWDLGDGRILAALTPHRRVVGGQFLVTSGAWTSHVLSPRGDGTAVTAAGRTPPGRHVELTIEPVRGQMVLLSLPEPVLSRVVECGPRYLVPRSDGRILVGSTEEWVGFEKRNTAEAVHGLLTFARRLVPRLADATFEQSWSGLRPHSPDGLPLIGRLAGTANGFVAAGHFRDGLFLSPITARLISQLLTGETPSLSLTAFDPGRPAVPASAVPTSAVPTSTDQ